MIPPEVKYLLHEPLSTELNRVRSRLKMMVPNTPGARYYRRKIEVITHTYNALADAHTYANAIHVLQLRDQTVHVPELDQLLTQYKKLQTAYIHTARKAIQEQDESEVIE